jgi:ubiquinone/menaquinone biosynthesis C-methylase UbiE
VVVLFFVGRRQLKVPAGQGDNVAMPGPTTVAATPPAPQQSAALQADLARRLKKLHRVFALDALRAQPLAGPEVVTYYEDCHDAYRKYHSADGAVHMALNDGDAFDADGFYGQARRMEASWASAGQSTSADVLELAFGQGFNLEYLARRHPQCRLQGIDLTPTHVQMATQRLQRAGLERVRLAQGDFHHLPYADASFDHVFCVEAFCYVTDLRQAFAEVVRVLRPGGSLTLFDGYLPRPTQALQANEALALELVAKGMAFDAFPVLADFLAQAHNGGLQLTTNSTLDAQVMPNLRRLEKITGAVIRFSWLGKWALARRSPMRGRNVLAGYLMRNAVELGLVRYHHLVLSKPA